MVFIVPQDNNKYLMLHDVEANNEHYMKCERKKLLSIIFCSATILLCFQNS